MQKKSSFFFHFRVLSKFGEANVTNKSENKGAKVKNHLKGDGFESFFNCLLLGLVKYGR